MAEKDVRYHEAALHRLRGDLLLQRADANALEAEGCFHRALDVARRQQGKVQEARAAARTAARLVHRGLRTLDLTDAGDLLAALDAG